MTCMTNADNFSFARVMAYGNIYSPWIKRQLVFTPLISLAVVLINIMLGFYSFGLPFIGLVSFIPAFMVYFGALVFAVGTDPAIETMLPVKWSEKALFVTVYALVVIPLCVNLPQLIVEVVVRTAGGELFDSNIYINTRNMTFGSFNTCLSYVQQLVPASVCLATVVSLTSKRIVMSVVWTIVSLVALSIFGAICGILGVFKYGIGKIETLAESQSANPTVFINALMSEMQPYMMILMGVCIIAIAVFVWLTCRSIKTRQL